MTDNPWGGFSNEDFALFERVSKALRKRAHGLMDEEDLYQSCALWALENPRKYGEAKEGSEERAFGRLWGAMCNLIRDEKARVGGYEPDDQFQYSPKALKKVLPLAFDPTWMEQSQEYSTDPKQKGGDHADPASAWVLVADVKHAFPQLREQDRLLLYKTLVGPGEYSQVCRDIANEAGVKVKDVQVQVHRALTRLGKILRSD